MTSLRLAPVSDTPTPSEELPLDPRVEHEQYALQRPAVIDPFPARVPVAAFVPGQQRFNHRPQLVTDLPRLRPTHPHSPPRNEITYPSTVPHEDHSARTP